MGYLCSGEIWKWFQELTGTTHTIILGPSNKTDLKKHILCTDNTNFRSTETYTKSVYILISPILKKRQHHIYSNII